MSITELSPHEKMADNIQQCKTFLLTHVVEQNVFMWGALYFRLVFVIWVSLPLFDLAAATAHSTEKTM